MTSAVRSCDMENLPFGTALFRERIPFSRAIMMIESASELLFTRYGGGDASPAAQQSAERFDFVRIERGIQSTFAPVDLITLPHFWISLRIQPLNCSGVLATTSNSIPASDALTSGRFTMRVISLW